MRRGRPWVPRANDSREARSLREAAIEFGQRLSEPAVGDHDAAGAKRNRALLTAAIAYSKVAVPRVDIRLGRLRAAAARAIDAIELHCTDEVMTLEQASDVLDDLYKAMGWKRPGPATPNTPGKTP